MLARPMRTSPLPPRPTTRRTTHSIHTRVLPRLGHMSGAWSSFVAPSSFVALGDSFTEGLDDVRADGSVAGWADRTAEVLAAREPGFRYANLAVRGLGLGNVIDHQIPAAVAMRPELVSIAAGGNDVLRPRFDLEGLGRQIEGAIGTLSATGATVLVFAGFDPPRLPFAS